MLPVISALPRLSVVVLPFANIGNDSEQVSRSAHFDAPVINLFEGLPASASREL